jgi:hypothetical protein
MCVPAFIVAVYSPLLFVVVIVVSFVVLSISFIVAPSIVSYVRFWNSPFVILFIIPVIFLSFGTGSTW